jgi:hypothetical protein
MGVVSCMAQPLFTPTKSLVPTDIACIWQRHNMFFIHAPSRPDLEIDRLLTNSYQGLFLRANIN